MLIDLFCAPESPLISRITFLNKISENSTTYSAYSKWLSATMATSHWPIKFSVFWLYIVCVFPWCMGNAYAIILNLNQEYQNMSQNLKNGQTTHKSNVKTARLLWVEDYTYWLIFIFTRGARRTWGTLLWKIGRWQSSLHIPTNTTYVDNLANNLQEMHKSVLLKKPWYLFENY